MKIVFSAVFGLAILPPRPGADIKDALAPTGTMRATFLEGNPVQGRLDKASGVISGPVADLVSDLARRLGVGFRITPSADARAIMDRIKAHTADIAFLAFDPSRAKEVDFSQPYSLAYNSYIVLAGSNIQNAQDVDRPGMRIAAVRGDSGELYLGRTLRQAQLRSITGLNPETAQKMLAAGEIDAYATNRQRLTEMAEHFPGLRVLPDNFYAVEQAIVVAKGNLAGLAVVNRFIDEARKSGLLKSTLERAKLSGVEVAPAR